MRVPKANVGPLVIPDSGLRDEQVLFLSDILPTGYMAAVNAAIGKGSTVAIFGAGPVGLMAAASARLLGAERIFMVDHHQYRLDFAAADLRRRADQLRQGRRPRQDHHRPHDRRGVDCDDRRGRLRGQGQHGRDRADDR